METDYKNEIITEIESKSHFFMSFLKENLPKKAFDTIIKLSLKADLYIFSGVIRDFFLKNAIIRDIDLVLGSEINILQVFDSENLKKNSYGGYKITINSVNFDIWYAHETWAYKKQPVFNFITPEYIFKTAFFNFSAIVFSFSDKKFYFSDSFIQFYKNKTIDYVNPLNNNYGLCIVNTLYNKERYNLKVRKKLVDLLYKEHIYNNFNYNKIQNKHFGKILYTSKTIEKFLLDYKKNTDKHTNKKTKIYAGSNKICFLPGF